MSFTLDKWLKQGDTKAVESTIPAPEKKVEVSARSRGAKTATKATAPVSPAKSKAASKMEVVPKEVKKPAAIAKPAPITVPSAKSGVSSWADFLNEETEHIPDPVPTTKTKAFVATSPVKSITKSPVKVKSLSSSNVSNRRKREEDLEIVDMEEDDEPIHASKRKTATPSNNSRSRKRVAEDDYEGDFIDDSELDPVLKPSKKARVMPVSSPSKSSTRTTSAPAVVHMSSPQKPKSAGGRGAGAGYSAFLAAQNRAGPPRLNEKPLPDGAPLCLYGKTFLVTGIMESLERDDMEKLIAHYGGHIARSVVKKLDYLVVGLEPGPKKIESVDQMITTGHHVKKLDEDGVFELIRTFKSPAKNIMSDVDVSKLPALPKIVPSSSATYNPSFGMDEESVNAAAVEPKQEPQGNIKLEAKGATAARKGSIAVGAKGAARTEIGNVTPSKSIETNVGSTPSASTTNAIASSDSVRTAMLWSEKYRPKNVNDIVGNPGVLTKLSEWLSMWDPVRSEKRAVLISGRPGIGKTSLALAVCRANQYELLEFNASDTRSKKSLEQKVETAIQNHTLSEYFTRQSAIKKTSSTPGITPKPAALNRKVCLIMDEVDGMSAGDRGGIAELIMMIKSTKVPIICICNDRASDKVKSLANYCIDLRMRSPVAGSIVPILRVVCKREGVTVPSEEALLRMAELCQGDIRQALNHLQTWYGWGDNKVVGTADEMTQHSSVTKPKTMDMGPFDVIPLLLSDPPAGKQVEDLDARLNHYFADSQLVPFFAFENYIRTIPSTAHLPLVLSGRITEKQRRKSLNPMDADSLRTLLSLAEASDTLSQSDGLENVLRSVNDWSLAPYVGMLSTVIPCAFTRGRFSRAVEFPSILGKISRTNKRLRLLRDIQSHMQETSPLTRAALATEFISIVSPKLARMLAGQRADVDEAMRFIDAYHLSRDDWDTIVVEFGLLTRDLSSQYPVDSKTKAAFTRSYNKGHQREKLTARSAGGLQEGVGTRVGDDSEVGTMDEKRSSASIGDEEEEEDEESEYTGSVSSGASGKRGTKDRLITERKPTSAGRGRGKR